MPDCAPRTPTPRCSISPCASAAGSRSAARCTCWDSTTRAASPSTSCADLHPLPTGLRPNELSGHAHASSRRVDAVGDLALDTAVTGSDGHYRARLSEDWAIWGPNGGYVASVALRAAGAHTALARPASIVGHYLGVASFDDVDIEVVTLRAAKRAESMRVSIN